MRLSALLIVISLMAVNLQGQTVTGPILGFAPDLGGTAIRPILGIPGASMLGGRLALDSDVSGVLISPSQDYAIAARTSDAQVVVIDLRLGASPLVAVAGSHRGADVMAFSPTGSV